MRRRRTAPADLPTRLRALHDLLEAGEDRMDPAVAAEGRALVERAGERLRLSSSHTVVALAGATGSGKSSLFNALVGLDLARVGVRRPTTGEPLACVWGPDGAGSLLEWLGVPRRHQVARESALDVGAERDLDGLVLLDLPDHDSTVLAHRLHVDRLVEMVDSIVWVVDPQKYADAALHDRYLRRLQEHAAVVVVVLNQADRLPAGAVAECERDLRRLLDEDGLGAARMVTTSVATGAGVRELRDLLVDAVRRREAATARMHADVERLLDRLEPQLAAGSGGDARAGATGRDVAARDREQLVAALGRAAGVPAVVDAVARSYRARSRAATGWPFTRWAGRLRPDPLRRLHLDGSGRGADAGRTSLPAAPPVARAQVDTAVRRVVEGASADLPARWVDGLRAAARPDGADLADALDRAVAGTPLDDARRPVWWALLGAVQWLLAAAVLVGAGWLLALFVIAWLQLPEPPTYDLEGLPLPTALLLGGAVGGLLVALLGRLVARVGARRRARRARRRLHDAVAQVADRLVLSPVSAELDRYARAREQLAAARGR